MKTKLEELMLDIDHERALRDDDLLTRMRSPSGAAWRAKEAKRYEKDPHFQAIQALHRAYGERRAEIRSRTRQYDALREAVRMVMTDSHSAALGRETWAALKKATKEGGK